MRTFVIGIIVVVISSTVLLYFGIRKYGRWNDEGIVGDRSQEALRLVCGADRYWRIDANRLPPDLLLELPIVQKWSVTDATILFDCLMKAPEAELRVVVTKAESIEWATKSFLASGIAPNADEAQAFRNFQNVAKIAKLVLIDRDKRKI